MDDKLKELFLTTDLTYYQMAYALGTTYKVVHGHLTKLFSKEERKARTSRMLRLARTGEKNPMYGTESNKRLDVIADGRGYLMVRKPTWYTGRKGSRHVFQHHVVMCEALGLTQVPDGFHVHHVDGDKTNNNINNLALLCDSAHSRLHSRERATTISKESRV
ncbi:HNH endonuclease [Phormidium phage Pf-WMP3]|uniref:Probable HNH-type endonuclease n=1 Tax=Phormidium phage Pf-WMP3 TaxID=2914005 RepID=A5HL46_9CAUD|nr:HNH endonuclease [Phormidium phage Pf-WMP3]ABQ12453.1 probable HNH-type endonuclease [Phormidium phage Pf-WMP3]